MTACITKKWLVLIAGTYVAGGMVIHAEACEERARKLRADLRRLEYNRSLADNAQFGQDFEFPVEYWYGRTKLKEGEARMELLRQAERARLLKTWSPLHRLWAALSELE